LIFEKADSDIRSHLDHPDQGGSLYGKLRALHHVATGLKQLHGADIAHQDLKPSNVLVFYVSSLLTVSKVADLGRASRAGNPSPYDDHTWAGDPKYAPPEVMYSFIDPDWSKRRIAADLYMLGGLVSFIFARTTSIAALLHALPTQFWPGNWDESFEDVLPYLQNAFSINIDAFAESVPIQLQNDILPIFRQLCNPDPRKRGFSGVPINRNVLERYLSSFDLMASRARSGRYEKRR
jgi:serine/threonine protein kinase